MPRGRWYLKLRATILTPFARSAEASVSPAKPSCRLPSKLNDSTRERSIAPPVALRNACPLTDFPPARRKGALGDRVRERIPFDLDPLLAAELVEPELAVAPPGILSEIEIPVP